MTKTPRCIYKIKKFFLVKEIMMYYFEKSVSYYKYTSKELRV